MTSPHNQAPVDLTFREYQEATASTAIYPDAGEGTWEALSYVALGLGEVGEIQGKIKKIIRDHNGEVTPELRAAIKKEMGDAYWYLARLSEELELESEEIVLGNLQKLQSRKQRGVLGGSGDAR